MVSFVVGVPNLTCLNCVSLTLNFDLFVEYFIIAKSTGSLKPRKQTPTKTTLSNRRCPMAEVPVFRGNWSYHPYGVGIMEFVDPAPHFTKIMFGQLPFELLFDAFSCLLWEKMSQFGTANMFYSDSMPKWGRTRNKGVCFVWVRTEDVDAFIAALHERWCPREGDATVRVAVAVNQVPFELAPFAARARGGDLLAGAQQRQREVGFHEKADNLYF